MYLKSIELQGFKSFANKINFEFHDGITAIVGPNGSGKSNVADAVRWVLGEQSSKQLRGSNMQDVIFSGTQNRKPQGYAYAALTLDNSDHSLAIDYDEVTVGRRVYRSGESEYTLNGTPCRLRDVYELFYDTGIGKEGYSIIGQGQIDKILSGKPEDRRELFDETVGIVKYKKRKAAAQKKLENEQINLNRVTDILSELEKQFGPLERQSEKAKEYLKLKEELKKYDINAYILDSGQINNKIKDVNSNTEIVNGQLEDLTGESNTLRVRYEELESSIASIDENINADREQINEFSVLSENLNGQIKVTYEQINTERAGITHIEGRLSDIAKELEERRAE
ncbi:MAG: AAA family ATPase, partial [Lachnospiraceae bacterium]|nr:AAA family ATPase [Lachnospiraceae bacterium]